MKQSLLTALAALLVLGVSASSPATIDLSRYFPNAAVEMTERAALVRAVNAWLAEPAPATPDAFARRLDAARALLVKLQRHDIFVYLRAEENVNDRADADADGTMGDLEDAIVHRIGAIGSGLGSKRLATWLRSPVLRPQHYEIMTFVRHVSHDPQPAMQRAMETALDPVIDGATAQYSALRRNDASLANDEDAYAALLASIVRARSGIATLRGFASAVDAAYYDRDIDPQTVSRLLETVRRSRAYQHYLAVAAQLPSPLPSPQPRSFESGVREVLQAEQAMGPTYAAAYEALFAPSQRRVEDCTAKTCDEAAFSVGYSGSTSALFVSRFNGSTNDVRRIAHESGHAVHRAFMNAHQRDAFANDGPHDIFESFAIFNELLFLDHEYRTAQTSQLRTFYLNAFIKDATFQVYGSAEQTDLEERIYRGVRSGALTSGKSFDELSANVYAKYEGPRAASDPGVRNAWARNRLYYTDSLYDVNYLVAGMLALDYFDRFERDPHGFSKRYVALLENGFTDSPENLERRFLNIDMSDPSGVMRDALRFIDARINRLAALEPNQGSSPPPS